jgi:uncharacterized protein (TIRG00374 family)
VNKTIKIAIGFAISIALLIYVLSQIDWAILKVEIANVQWAPIFITAALWIFHFFIRSIRWHYLLPADKSASVGLRFESIMIGVFATFLLPLRAGEFIRPMYLAKYSDVGFTQGFVSVFIERFFDLLCVLGLFVAVSFMVPNLPQWTTSGAVVFGTLASGIFVFILFCLLLPNFITLVTSKVTSVLPIKVSNIINKIVNDVIQGARAIGSVHRFLMVIFLTAVIWGLNVIVFHLFLQTVSIPFDWMLSTTLTVLIALAVAAPSAPGFIGVYQVATVACFSLFGYSAEKATAYSLFSHAQQYIMFAIIGVYILVKRGLSLKALRQNSPS